MSRIRQRTVRCTPALAATAAALVGLINVASALTPNIRWRGRLLLDIEPVEAVRLFHAFALPAGAALLLVSPYLLKRRRRAWQAAIVLMLALGLLDLLKGLDVEETVLTWATAALLFASATEFRVEHDAITLRSSVWRVPLLGAFGLSLTALAAWVSRGHPSFGAVARETGDLLAWRTGPLRFEHHAIAHHAFAWVPLGVHFVEIGTLLAMAYVVFRPLAAPASLPGPAARRAAAALVRAHGSDTLSFFKLRADKHYFFSPDRSAFVGYRVENGVLLLSGDPVGPDAALDGLLADLKAFARARGLKLAAVGARAAHDVPGRRGDHRCGAVHAGGASHPQGAPVGEPPAQGRLRGRAASRLRARARSRRRGRGGARARPRRCPRTRFLDGDGLAARRPRRGHPRPPRSR
jgi:lysyl-tRNA synthetase class 2